MTNKITLVLITLKILAKLLLLFATPTPPTPTSPFSLTHFCLVLLTQANHFISIKSRASLVHRTWNRKSLRSSIHMVFDFQLWFATCFFLNKNLEAPFDFFSSHLQTLFVSWEELHTTTFFFFWNAAALTEFIPWSKTALPDLEMICFAAHPNFWAASSFLLSLPALMPHRKKAWPPQLQQQFHALGVGMVFILLHTSPEENDSAWVRRCSDKCWKMWHEDYVPNRKASSIAI